MISTPTYRGGAESMGRASKISVDEPRTDEVSDWFLWWQGIDKRTTAQDGCGPGRGGWHRREPDEDE